MLALPQGMLGREACVYVRASSAMLGRAGLMVRQVGPARNRCACASLSRAASHTSGAYPFVLSRRCGACRGRALFCAKINRRRRRISGFSPRHDVKIPIRKTWNQTSKSWDAAPFSSMALRQFRSIVPGSCHGSLFTVPLVRARRHHLGGSGSKLCALLQHPRALGWSAAVLECRRCG